MAEISFGQLPTRTYQIRNGRVMDKVDGLEAIQQLIEKTLVTERFEYLIYTPYFGAELMALYGQHPSFVKTDIRRRVEEALLIDTRISSIENFNIRDYKAGIMNIEFTAVTIFGELKIERRLSFSE